MSYFEVAAEFLYSCFRAGLCVELFVVKLIRDLFAHLTARLDEWCESGLNQLAHLAGRAPAREPRAEAVRLAGNRDHALAES